MRLIAAILFSAVAAVLGLAPGAGLAAEKSPGPAHGAAMHGDLKYPPGFTHLQYVNPNAPKGGTVRLSATGTFDSFNSFIVKGNPAAGVGFIYDNLMHGTADEAFSQYGQLAQSVEMPKDRSWVAFTLRKEARWHDGKPITVDDVVFTFKVLQDDASAEIRSSFKPFSLEVLGPREFRFHIPPLLRKDASIVFTLGGIPVLHKHYWATHDITKTTVEPPLGSGSYRIGQFEVGRWVEFERVENYWGDHLAVNKGRNNFDIIKYDYFRDDQIQTEALKANVIDVHDENIATTWNYKYDIPAHRQGFLKKSRIKLLKPSGMWWPIFWNMDQPRFQDIRVRKALWLMGDMIWGAS